LCSSDCSVQATALCNTGVGVKTKEYYETFVHPSNIMTVFNVAAGHTFVRFYPLPNLTDIVSVVQCSTTYIPYTVAALRHKSQSINTVCIPINSTCLTWRSQPKSICKCMRLMIIGYRYRLLQVLQESCAIAKMKTARCALYK